MNFNYLCILKKSINLKFVFKEIVLLYIKREVILTLFHVSNCLLSFCNGDIVFDFQIKGFIHLFSSI
jgi:hypothetical protein